MRMIVFAALPTTVATVMVAGCGERGAVPPADAVVKDSAGVAVVESPGPGWTEGEGWSVGAPLGTAGGMGDGPGEFRIIQAMGVTRADSVWVYDYSHRRLTFLDSGGQMVGMASLRPALSAGAIVGRLADGSFVAAEMWSTGRTGLAPSEIDAWKERQLQDLPPARRPSVRAYLAETPIPERRPAYGDLILDAGGGLWVAVYAHVSDAPERWQVFDGRGVWLGAVAMPEGFRPLSVGPDRILGIRTDAWDAQRVELRVLDRDG